jgi:hypothetical protein
MGNNPKQLKTVPATVESTNGEVLVAHVRSQREHMRTRWRVERSDEARECGGEVHRWRRER